MRTRVWRWRLSLALLALLTTLAASGTANAAPAYVTARLRTAFAARAQALFVRGDGAELAQYYDQSYSHGVHVVGKRLWEYERDRIAQFQRWLDMNRMQVTAHTVDLRCEQITVSNGFAHVVVRESIGFHWVYTDKPDHPTLSCVGTDHEVDLVYKDRQWLIRRDDYRDPFRPGLKADHRSPRG